jgi:hypothetical protein
LADPTPPGAQPLDKLDLVLRELQDFSRRLARIEEVIPVLAALSAGSEADKALREQRRARQARGSRYLAGKMGSPVPRARTSGRCRD